MKYSCHKYSEQLTKPVADHEYLITIYFYQSALEDK